MIEHDMKKAKWSRVLIDSMVVLLLTALIEWFYFGFCNFNFSVVAASGDGLLGFSEFKEILKGSDALKGWPQGQDLSCYLNQTAMLYWIFIKGCELFIHNENIIFNLH